MNQNKLIHEFGKNSTEKVRAEFSNFNGKDLFSLRVYFKAGEGEDDWKPTKKGICVQLHQIPELKAAIDKALQECNSPKCESR
jgi:hypothetical protein